MLGFTLAFRIKVQPQFNNATMMKMSDDQDLIKCMIDKFVSDEMTFTDHVIVDFYVKVQEGHGVGAAATGRKLRWVGWVGGACRRWRKRWKKSPAPATPRSANPKVNSAPSSVFLVTLVPKSPPFSPSSSNSTISRVLVLRKTRFGSRICRRCYVEGIVLGFQRLLRFCHQNSVRVRLM